MINGLVREVREEGGPSILDVSRFQSITDVLGVDHSELNEKVMELIGQTLNKLNNLIAGITEINGDAEKVLDGANIEKVQSSFEIFRQMYEEKIKILLQIKENEQSVFLKISGLMDAKISLSLNEDLENLEKYYVIGYLNKMESLILEGKSVATMLPELMSLGLELRPQIFDYESIFRDLVNSFESESSVVEEAEPALQRDNENELEVLEIPLEQESVVGFDDKFEGLINQTELIVMDSKGEHLRNKEKFEKRILKLSDEIQRLDSALKDMQHGEAKKITKQTISKKSEALVDDIDEYLSFIEDRDLSSEETESYYDILTRGIFASESICRYNLKVYPHLVKKYQEKVVEYCNEAFKLIQNKGFDEENSRNRADNIYNHLIHTLFDQQNYHDCVFMGKKYIENVDSDISLLQSETLFYMTASAYNLGLYESVEWFGNLFLQINRVDNLSIREMMNYAKRRVDSKREKLTIVENVEPKIDYKHGAFIVPVDPASVDKFLTIPPLPPRKREVKRETGLKKYGEDFNRADFDSSLERIGGFIIDRKFEIALAHFERFTEWVLKVGLRENNEVRYLKLLRYIIEIVYGNVVFENKDLEHFVNYVCIYRKGMNYRGEGIEKMVEGVRNWIVRNVPENEQRKYLNMLYTN
ncbi:hypothetical protein A2229_01540 [Candidatus Peregrinibacteria bacterium RIFOXYA2_FULL_33_7]|nr:MAG: hypothetical protein A2229_01540 [Candidatus Peregrinibacteria bacterium RIFOXYA2_FULL_33_7]